MNKVAKSKFVLPFMTALCLLLSTLPVTTAWAGIDLRKNVGDGNSSSGDIKVEGTVRPIAAGTSSLNGGYSQTAGFWVAGPAPLSPGMTFVVTKVADTADGLCNADCSLREAIIAANANPGLDNITFNIGSGLKTIFPLSVLPLLSDPVNIDGTTQPGFSGTPLIEIDGTNAGDVNGLRISGGNSIVRGLIIGGFRAAGLSLFTKGNNLVAGNFIGTNATGTAVHSGLQNNGLGLDVESSNNIIGGTTVADRNVIAGNKNSNSSRGLIIGGGSSGNVVIGNHIGTDVTGNITIGHDNDAILIQNSSANIIGGVTASAHNVIAGKPFSTGINVVDSFGNKIIGDFIGGSPNGTSLGCGYGVLIQGSSHDNTIGGTNAGEANTIQFNNLAAVSVTQQALNNSILGNRITGNNFGIDLKESLINANDLNDVDAGPNNLQNFPLITSAVSSAGSTQISGTLNSEANKQYRIELFANTACNQHGNGEGAVFLGAITASLGGNNGTFNLSVPGNVTSQLLTATATDPLGNTSEFSPCFSAAGTGFVNFSAVSYVIVEGGQLAINVSRTGDTSSAASVSYATTNETAVSGSDYTAKSGTLNWASGDSTDKVVLLQISDDTIDEPTETFKVVLSDPSGVTIGSLNSTQIQISDTTPPASLSIGNANKAEGNSGTTAFNFNVTVSPASGKIITVEYHIVVGGSATVGNDYQPADGILTFQPDQTSQPITVLVNGDSQDEPNENFLVQLSNPTNAVLAISQGTGTILDDDGGAPSSVQFSQATYNVQEQLGALSITVNRTGDASNAASVVYETSDATATQKADFEYEKGKLNFAPGETSKTIVLLLNEDILGEGTETLGLTLSDPIGAQLGQATATVSIADDSPETFNDPVDDPQSFVYAHYHDFLNREPDAAGLAFWTNEISSCGNNAQCIDAKRTNVSAAFFLSSEFQQTGYLVYRTYKAAYGNLPSAPIPLTLKEFLPDTQAIGRGVVVNKQGWEQVLENNKNAFMAEFVQRGRFNQKFPISLTPAQFVNSLFANATLLPSDAERAAVVSEFGNATNTADMAARARVLRLISESPTLVQLEFDRAFVLMQYFGYLRRNPVEAPEPSLNYDGYNFWLNKLQFFHGNYVNADLVKAFIVSSEYRQRFGP
jgi:CSLREA domain-containing protein